jgi:hypothetical protein
MPKPLAILALLALLTGCPAPSKSPAPKDSAPTKTATPTPAASLPALTGEIKDETHAVICGCLVKEIGHCGEYMVMDGRHVEITDHGKGSMPFCGKGRELKAKLSGTYVEGKLKASKLEVVKQ